MIDIELFMACLLSVAVTFICGFILGRAKGSRERAELLYRLDVANKHVETLAIDKLWGKNA